MKNLILTIIVVLAVGVLGVFLIKNQTNVPAKDASVSRAENHMSDDLKNQPLVEINNQSKGNEMHLITLETNFGTIQFQTYDADAPKTVKNFVDLINKGFYNNLTFHRVIKGFMIQGGDPNGNGTGGPGYKFEDELNPNTESYKTGYKRGVVAMANSGPDTNGSQFFIMQADYPLPNNYTIFGHVIKGQEAVDAIVNVPKDSNDKPLSPVQMKSVKVEKVK